MTSNKRLLSYWLGMLVGGFFTAPSAAIESITIVLKDHLFQPDKVEVPANTKVRLIIENQDTQVEEFDSFDLNREKVLFPNRKSVIYIGPLMPGEYKFFGEFSPSTAQGIVVVKEEKGAS